MVLYCQIGDAQVKIYKNISTSNVSEKNDFDDTYTCKQYEMLETSI